MNKNVGFYKSVQRFAGKTTAPDGSAAIAAGSSLALTGKILGGTAGNALVIAAFFVNFAILFCGRQTTDRRPHPARSADEE